MSEPDNLVLEILKELRAELREQRTELRGLRQDMRAGFDRLNVLEIKFDGLTHAVMSGFGGILHQLKDLTERVTMVEAERA